MAYFLSVLIGYAFGCINPAYLLGRAKGHNVKKEGSGNAGASNAAILLGVRWGVIVALIDIFKAFFSMRIAGALFPEIPFAPVCAGSACIMGHLYPVTMRFRGGKGLAALGGVMLAYDWRAFLVMLALGCVLLLLTHYIAIVTVETAVVFPFVLAVVYHDPITALIVAFCVPFMIVKHLENFRRIKAGKELRVNWLWKKNTDDYNLSNEEKDNLNR